MTRTHRFESSSLRGQITASQVDPTTHLSDNQAAWKTPDVVGNYVAKDRLHVPEARLLELLRTKLGGLRMLDLGVGAGRTTGHFAPLAKAYVGVDNSPAMIESCRQKFGHLRDAAFHVGDARQLDFPSASFDFVFFSFNGLDSMDRPDREKVLLEMKRVLRVGGLLLFSTHNTRNLRQIYSLQFPRDPRRLPWEWRRYCRIRKENGPEAQFKGREWFTIRDGADNFRFWVFYILPELQLRELEAMGLRQVQVFGLQDGARLSEAAVRRNRDMWLHYLCTV